MIATNISSPRRGALLGRALDGERHDKWRASAVEVYFGGEVRFGSRFERAATRGWLLGTTKTIFLSFRPGPPRSPQNRPEMPELAAPDPENPDPGLTSGLNKKIKYRLKCWSVFGRFPAKLGPRTPPDGSGSKNGAEST